MAGKQPPTSSNGITQEIVIPSEPEKTADVDRLIEDMTAQAGYDDAMRGDIAIAVNEVVKNAILHGNKCDVEKEVKISCTCQPNEFRINVYDHGKGFDPGNVPDPLDPQNILKESGRGLLMMHKLYVPYFTSVTFIPSSVGEKMTSSISVRKINRPRPDSFNIF